MSDRPLEVYVIQRRSERDYADCQAALDRVPAQLVSLPFIGAPDEVIGRARDADALIISSSPVIRPAVAQVPRRRGEEIARVLLEERPLNVVNPELYAPGRVRRGR